LSKAAMYGILSVDSTQINFTNIFEEKDEKVRDFREIHIDA